MTDTQLVFVIQPPSEGIKMALVIGGLDLPTNPDRTIVRMLATGSLVTIMNKYIFFTKEEAIAYFTEQYGKEIDMVANSINEMKRTYDNMRAFHSSEVKRVSGITF